MFNQQAEHPSRSFRGVAAETRCIARNVSDIIYGDRGLIAIDRIYIRQGRNGGEIEMRLTAR